MVSRHCQGVTRKVSAQEENSKIVRVRWRSIQKEGIIKL